LALRDSRQLSRSDAVWLDSPLQYLPLLNVFISVFLALVALMYRTKTNVSEGFWLFLLLPGLVLGMVIYMRSTIAEVGKGLEELQGMRYGYKGA
jgi:hypothetical protein